MLMVVFGLFFGRLAGLPSDGLPYSIFVLAALVPWTFFSSALAASSRSVVASSQVVSKVYFPRLIIPVAAAAAFLVDLALAFAFLVVIEPFFGIYPTWRFVFIPPLAVFALLTALCFGVWLAALNVRYRDVIYTVPFLIQALMFASPIGYPSSLIPADLRCALRTQPARRPDRGLPLGRRRCDHAPRVGGRSVVHRDDRPPRLGSRLLRPERELVRGRHLMATMVRAESLGKRYELGAEHRWLRQIDGVALERLAAQARPGSVGAPGDVGAEGRLV